MKFLKKWALIIGLFIGSFILVSAINNLFKIYADVDWGESIVGIYAAITMIWIIFAIIKTTFKISMTINILISRMLISKIMASLII